MTPEDKNDILKLLTKYEKTFIDLERYDEGRIETCTDADEKAVHIDLQEAQLVITELKTKATNHVFFGKEKVQGAFKAILEGVHQSFGGKDIYPSIEDKAVNLFYLIIKNHPFSDGNKRIGSAMFLLFLDKNKKLDTVSLDSDKLAALALLLAESPPSQKDNVIDFVTRSVFGTGS
ncbi:MAG: type II toxin-antitoxin system death-on-curing family toxin [Solitalea-like symbiont of Tyrophagus putrescentiae]